ncbi:helix-turn-helix transcriptional regulator [Burkholderia pseudomallei]|uniref:helix-turn-helix transcriptional regulator n=1 Tax=Burkholderia pseudomallei TaxID=28450 RepID=UPI002AB4A2F8|nr:helix-turn-helix transcriptional regulator [Burkholderia pseudomallei]MDY7820508.1 helix-turn-helix transcriptional regulator [Burkholderia pseudomallei]
MQHATKHARQARRLVLDASKLAELREEHGIASDAELARVIGVDPVTLYRIRTGRTRASNEFMAGVKSAFPGTSLDALFTVEKAA